MNYAIETRNLGFGYDTLHPILKDINLQVPKGSIYGFLGVNGAGKSTTIRLVTGLLGNRENIFLLGKPLQKYSMVIYQKIGVLIEAPSLYEHLTAAENLEIAARYFGQDRKRVMETLSLVGLAETGKKTVRKFSMGMKQRLGIALALLPDPELLILDEPINGLDPQGIKQIRELLLWLNKEQGKTIFLSSHILSEIEKISSHVGIIHQGKLVYQNTLEMLKEQTTLIPETVFEVSKPEAAQRCFKALGIENVNSSENRLSACIENPALVASLAKELVNNQVDIFSIEKKQRNLEDWFMNLVEEPANS